MSLERPVLRCILFAPLVVIASVLVADGAAPDDVLQQYDARIDDTDRSHWAYQPIQRPPLPAVQRSDWVRTPIDSFVLARLEQRGWAPNPPVEPRALLRRMYLDLIGLPPTIAEQEAFLASSSPRRVEELVDDLLQRPGHGERWGRYWLDLVRYAESNGYERDAEKPHVWRYRDYVINALNADKPYDRFVLEQLAGDELPDASSETVLATGFYRLGPWDDEPADFEQDRHDQLDDMIRTASQVFLGLTLGCARCHDHKFDALTMHDYYRLSAIFAPLERPQAGRTDLDAFAGNAEQLAALARRDAEIDQWRQRQQAVRDRFRDEFLASGQSGLPAEVVQAFGTPEGERSDAEKKLVSEHQTRLAAELVAHLPPPLREEYAEAERAIDQLRSETPDLPKGYFLIEREQAPPESFLLLRGRAATPGPPVEPGFPTVLVSAQPQFANQTSTSGRRLILARWLANPEHPLTARVIVNRVWQFHFGEGLVRTPSDFGIIGDEPTHPELLDWLAHWFIHDAGWSLKELHRLIACSSTYRMSKTSQAEYRDEDPENRLLWRFPYRRLPVEALRDSMLASSGELNRAMGGPAVKLVIPAVVVEGHADRATVWQPSPPSEQTRRTVYAFVKRSLVVPMLEVLDLCDTTRSTDQRNITSVAPQALTLFNGDFVNQQAQRLAERVVRECPADLPAQIDRAWRHALSRPPTPTELAAMLTFVSVQGEPREGLTQVCRVIYNLNEFAYPN